MPPYNKILEFGEILITMTSDNYNVWQGGAKGERNYRADLALRRARTIYEDATPSSMTALRPLGDLAFSTEGDKKGKYATLLVGYDKNKIPNPTSPPLKLAEGFEYIYQGLDLNNAGNYVGPQLRIWRVKPPAGYVALGDFVSTKQTGEPWHSSPPGDHPWCVREDLVASGTYSSSKVWTSKGAYGWNDGSIWDLQPGSNTTSKDEQGWFPLSAGTFRFQGDKEAQPGLKIAKVLRVPLEKTLVGFPNTAPVYDKGNPPVEGTLVGEYNHGTAVLPYTAFFSARDAKCLEYIDNPFWTLSKGARFHCFKVYNNAGPAAREFSTEYSMGVSTEQSNTISQQAGVSVTASVGIKALGGGVDTTLNYSFTEENTTSYSEYKEYKETKTTSVPAWCISVLWTKNLEIIAEREDGEVSLSRLVTDANQEPWQTGEELLHGGSDGRSRVTVGERMFEKRIPLD